MSTAVAPHQTPPTTSVRRVPSTPDDADLAAIEREERVETREIAGDLPDGDLPAGFDLYLHEARRSRVARQPLSTAQQLDLARQGKTMVLAESALFLVVAEADSMVARELAQTPMDTDTLDLRAELVAAGNVGLARAAKGYDWRRGFAFSTYAIWCIRHEMQAVARARRLERRQVVSLEVIRQRGQDVEAPDLVLDDPDALQAPGAIYQRHRRLNADLVVLRSLRLLTDVQLRVLALLLGARPPDTTSDTTWTPPAGWTPGMAHSMRLVAGLLGMSHPSVSRRLEETEEVLLALDQSGTLPYALVARRMLALLVHPGPKMRLGRPAVSPIMPSPRRSPPAARRSTKMGGIPARPLTCNYRDAMVEPSARAP